jgi:hypothetical protein
MLLSRMTCDWELLVFRETRARLIRRRVGLFRRAGLVARCVMGGYPQIARMLTDFKSWMGDLEWVVQYVERQRERCSAGRIGSRLERAEAGEG